MKSSIIPNAEVLLSNCLSQSLTFRVTPAFSGMHGLAVRLRSRLRRLDPTIELVMLRRDDGDYFILLPTHPDLFDGQDSRVRHVARRLFPDDDNDSDEQSVSRADRCYADKLQATLVSSDNTGKTVIHQIEGDEVLFIGEPATVSVSTEIHTDDEPKPYQLRGVNSDKLVLNLADDGRPVTASVDLGGRSHQDGCKILQQFLSKVSIELKLTRHSDGAYSVTLDQIEALFDVQDREGQRRLPFFPRQPVKRTSKVRPSAYS